MPNFNFDDRCSATLLAMKKLMAANGSVVGGYTLWTTADAKTGALVVNHKGIEKAKAEGKAIKKELKGSKQVAAGQVLISKKKIYFLNTQGNPEKVTKFVKKVVAVEYKKLAFLKKFQWATEDEVERLLNEADQEDGAPDENVIALEDMLDLSPEEMAALSPEELEARKEELANEMAAFKAEMMADEELMEFFSDSGVARALEQQNQDMQDSFRAAAAEDELWRRELTVQRDRIAEMEAAIESGPGRTRALIELNEARAEYALNQEHGTDPFPQEVNGQIDESAHLLMDHVNDNSADNIAQQHQAMIERIQEFHSSLTSMDEETMTEQMSELIREIYDMKKTISILHKRYQGYL
jgi:hypothetical protein